MLSDDTKQEILEDMEKKLFSKNDDASHHDFGGAVSEISNSLTYKNPERDPDLHAAILDFFFRQFETKKGKEFVRELFYYTKNTGGESNLVCLRCSKGKLPAQALKVFFDTMKRVGGNEFLLEQLKNEPRVKKEDNAKEEQGEQKMTSPTGPILTCALIGFLKYNPEEGSGADKIKVVLEYSFEAGGNEFLEQQLRFKFREGSKEVFSSLDLFILLARSETEKPRPGITNTLNLLLDAAHRVDQGNTGGGRDANSNSLLRYLCKGLLKRIISTGGDLPPRAITKQLCCALADAGVFRASFTPLLSKFGIDKDFPLSVEYYEHRQQQGMSNTTNGFVYKEEEEEEEKQPEALSEDEKRKLLSRLGEDFLDLDNSVDSVGRILSKLLSHMPTSAAEVDFILIELDKVHTKAFMKYLLISIFSSHEELTRTFKNREPAPLPSMLRRFFACAKRVGGDDFLLDILRARDPRKPAVDLPLKVVFNSAFNVKEFAHELVEIFLETAVGACNGDSEKIVAVLESLIIEGNVFSYFCTQLKDDSFPLFRWLVDFIRRSGGDEFSRKCFKGALENMLRKEGAFVDFFACTLADIDFQFFCSELKQALEAKDLRGSLDNPQINELILYSPLYAEYKEERRLRSRAPHTTTTTTTRTVSSNIISVDGTATIKRKGLKKFFDFFDLERNGLLDKAAMCAAITSSFPLCSANEVEKAVRGVEVKSENRGKLDFDQFCTIVENII